VKDCGAPAIKAAALSAGSNTTSFAITVLEIGLGCVFVEAMLPVDAPNKAVKVNPQMPTRPSMTKSVCATTPLDTAALTGDRVQPPPDTPYSTRMSS
jgi:hypothetical protein